MTNSLFTADLGGDSDLTDRGSNMEVLSTTSVTLEVEGYRWLGEKYLEYKKAREVMAAVDMDQMIDLNLALQQKLSEFPWQSAYNAVSGLVNTGIGRDLRDTCASMQRAYLVAAGMILTSSNRCAKAMLIASMSYVGSAGSARRPLSTISSNATSNARPQVTTPAPSRSVQSSDDEMLPQYSMALNQYRQRKDITMRYFDDKRLSLDPPLWQQSIQYDGKVWTARARQKAKARQKAEKKACEALGIEVD